VALLVPFPPLSLLYLLAIRAERVTPKFAPIVVFAVLPLAAAVVGVVAVRRRSGALEVALLAAALAEMLWALCVLAMVGFAVAGRSG
jgi:hypothetical protein